MRTAIRFYYVPGAEKTTNEARFLAVVELLGGYIRPYYTELT